MMVVLVALLAWLVLGLLVALVVVSAARAGLLEDRARGFVDDELISRGRGPAAS